MKHVHFTQPGEPSVLTLKESEIPKPKDGEVLVRIKASGLNRADTEQRKGVYPPPPGASPILGLEAAGYVCKEDGTIDESQRVMALLSGGACSQYAIVKQDHLIPIPSNITMEQAGGIPEVWITALLLLELAQIKPNDKVLIYAGASGVGIAATQLVKMFGGFSVVTVSTDEKIEFTKNVGANAAINYKKEKDLAQAVLDATGGKGVDIILDCVGASFIPITIKSAATDARWVLYGWMGGSVVENFNLISLMAKRISLIPSTLRSRPTEFKTNIIKKFNEKVLPHLEAGEFKIYVDNIVKVDWSSVDPIRKAHEQMESNQTTGKIIFSFE